MSDLGNDIRRISKYNELIKLIDEVRGIAVQAQKLSIANKKSIAYLDTNNLDTTVVEGASGQTQPNAQINTGNTGTPDGNGGAYNNTNGTGTSQGGTTPGPSNETPEGGASSGGSASDSLSNMSTTDRDGVYDSESILDNTQDTEEKAPPAIYPDGAPGAPSINTITNLQTDDETRDVMVHLADANIAFYPPEDWESQFLGPVEETYRAGYVWSNVLDASWTNSFEASVTAAHTLLQSISATEVGSFLGVDYPYGSPYEPTGSIPTGTSSETFGYMFDDPANPGSYFVYPGALQSCASFGGSEPAACSADAPLMYNWPERNVTQLAWLTPYAGVASNYGNDLIGRFVPNPFDISVPTTYENGASILDLKTLGGTAVRLGPLPSGGWYFYYRDVANSNLPTGSVTANSVLVIRPDRTSAGYITPNSLSKMLAPFS